MAGEDRRRLFADGVPDALRPPPAAWRRRPRTGPYSGASPRSWPGSWPGSSRSPREGAGLTPPWPGWGASASTTASTRAIRPAPPTSTASPWPPPWPPTPWPPPPTSRSTWDQAPVATHLEQRLVAGLPTRVGGTPEVAGGGGDQRRHPVQPDGAAAGPRRRRRPVRAATPPPTGSARTPGAAGPSARSWPTSASPGRGPAGAGRPGRGPAGAWTPTGACAPTS